MIPLKPHNKTTRRIASLSVAFISLLLSFVFLFSNTVIGQTTSGNKSLSNSLKPKTFSYEEMLAPTTRFSPLYTVEKDQGGALKIIEPSNKEEALYTEAIIAFLAHSVKKRITQPELDEFIQKTLGEHLFEKCPLGEVEKLGPSCYILYLDKRSENSPEIVYLRFSEFKETESDFLQGSAIITLDDGTKIQVLRKDLDQVPKGFRVQDKEGIQAMHEVSQAVISGRSTQEAMDMFFTSAAFQDRRLDIFSGIANNLLTAIENADAKPDDVKKFLREIIRSALELSEKNETSQSMQLMAGQALTIMSWMERGVEGANDMRITTDEENMAKNDKRGLSFIDERTFPESIVEVKEEGGAGFYWRGTEKTKKLGENIAKKAIFSQDRLNAARARLVMYLMDHGFIKVPDGLLEATEQGKVSTIHETFFINNMLPGSFQTTSTGVGHFQGRSLDFKQVSEGQGIQFNVRYNSQGDIQSVIAQKLKPGDWTLALPGYVDYMVNLGGLRFNDFSVNLSDEEAKLFSPAFDFGKDNFEKVKAAISQNAKKAPFLVNRRDDQGFIMQNLHNVPSLLWVESIATDHDIVNTYETLTSENLSSFVKKIAEAYTFRVSSATDNADIMLDLSEKRGIGSETEHKAPSLNKADVITSYIDENSKFIGEILSGTNKISRDVLIRVSVESLEALGQESVNAYLSEALKAPNFFIELFSSESIAEVGADKYEQYGMEKKSLPTNFTRTRENTVTLLPVLKAEDISTKGQEDGEWHLGGIQPTDTIVSPVGLSYDRAGIIRGIIFGLRLAEIARQERVEGEADESFVEGTLASYRNFCTSSGNKNFDLEASDLIAIATGNINKITASLNKLIRSLPIIPLNIEEIRVIYEHAREALIRA